ncbi:MAG: hypothetical protein RIQ89_444 [Bacteroidota bacterium]
MYKKTSLFLIGFLYCYSITLSCGLKLAGKLLCINDNAAIAGAVIHVEGTNKSCISNMHGYFQLDSICTSSIQLHIDLVGYVHVDTSIYLTDSNTNIILYMESKDLHADEIHIDGIAVHPSELQTLSSEVIPMAERLDLSGKSLGEITKIVPGVTTLSTGGNVVKPVIHGLHSNRILILNNGVRQEGQQWGSEHAPEIDPFTASQITILKGAASLVYGADAVGGVILLEPNAILPDKMVKGDYHLIGNSNGRSITNALALEKGWKKIGVRVQTSQKRGGNLKTPKYYLDNTGTCEINASAQLTYSGNRLQLNGYLSTYNNKYGIFSGSNIGGDSTELIAAALKNKPGSKNEFDYTINRGYQTVGHTLSMIEGNYKLPKSEINFKLSRQLDERQEYDFNIPYTNGADLSNLPGLSFKLKTHQLNITYNHPSFGLWSGTIGFDFFTQGNIFKGLGYRTLIPNFRNYNGGIFIIEKIALNKTIVEMGARIDRRIQTIYRLNPTTLQLETPQQEWNNLSGAIGVNHTFTPRLSGNINLGTAWRAPNAYELFVDGIHGATSTYEKGDSTLEHEKSLQLNAGIQFQQHHLSFKLGAYVNYIDRFIYLEPSRQYAVTYQGVFRVFNFNQQATLFIGGDMELSYQFENGWSSSLKGNIVRAQNLITDLPAWQIPPANFRWGINKSFTNFQKLEGLLITLEFDYTSMQKRFVKNLDYINPPPSYSLTNVGLSYPFKVKKYTCNLALTVENLFNRSYRNYMNFFRYYADEIGRNISLKLNFKI